MRKHHKSILSFTLILAILLCTLPAGASETQYLEPVTVTYINPLYADVITEEELNVSGTVFLAEPEYHTNVEDAAAVLREGMTCRAASIQVGFQLSQWDQETVNATFDTLFQTALTHTGQPVEGDYLLRHFAGYKGKISAKIKNGTYLATLTYNMTYHSDYDQEAAVSEAVDAFIADNIDKGMTDYEKFCVIYDWICDNVVYDHDNLEDDAYTLKYSAYAAMIDKTAVCQGYANLLYRMLLEVGIDNRIISGTGNGGDHGWNIVKLDGLYYDVDVTWDASWHQSGIEYQWCLKNEADFGLDHTRDAEYTTTDFSKQYPMATEDYDPDKAVRSVSGYQVLTSNTSVNWSLTGDAYVDLAGFAMTGTVQLNGYQLYGMDSTTDSYTCDSMGTFNCVDENGNEIVPARHWKGTAEQIGSIKRYMTIDTGDGYTFHRFYLGITHISMKPSTEDVGFKAIVAGDEMVMAQLDPDEAFGYSLHLGDFNTVTTYHALDGFISGHPISLRIEHFNMDDYGETTLYAKVMLKLSDGTVISTNETTMTVRSMLEQLNSKYASLLQAQLESIQEMLSRHPIVKQWGLDKLLGLS